MCVNFGTFNNFCPQKSYDTSLLFFGANWKTRWHVYHSIATHTLRMGTSHSQGQTIRVWCTMLLTLSSLTLTNTLQTKKCGNLLKYLRIFLRVEPLLFVCCFSYNQPIQNIYHNISVYNVDSYMFWHLCVIFREVQIFETPWRFPVM